MCCSCLACVVLGLEHLVLEVTHEVLCLGDAILDQFEHRERPCLALDVERAFNPLNDEL